jgi:16S rRNA (guanine527-N7)-methyltransferase
MAAVDTATIAQLLRPFAELAPEQLEQTSAYLALLLKWNDKMNLTSVRLPEQIVTRHFGESFFAASRLLSPGSSESVIDLGSGAGFPGLPLAMFAPAAQVTLIESNVKKTVFLHEVIHALQLKNAKTLRQRAATYAGKADLVTMRAVEEFERALPVALGLVREGGRLALMIGKSQIDLAKTMAFALDWREATPVPGSHSRVLLVGTRPLTVGRS